MLEEATPHVGGEYAQYVSLYRRDFADLSQYVRAGVPVVAQVAAIRATTHFQMSVPRIELFTRNREWPRFVEEVYTLLSSPDAGALFANLPGKNPFRPRGPVKPRD